ncbi:TOBE domain-containing protein [Deinococcus petrolearius]|uniref:Molybdopterin-binding protein n=1 Tax=Deinococcus petrolearius TaxID=1751295 RepID=A0ABW1DJR4_9DEIO
MQLSARNVIAGRITAVKLGSVEAEVSLELSPGVVVTSVITRTSAERLGLKEGMEASAVIKASDVMLAVE